MSTFRILCLDGGGSKGVYTLGVPNEIESLLGSDLSSKFDLIYGTSTGAIIAAGLRTGMKSKDIFNFYINDVSTIMKQFTSAKRSISLEKSLKSVFLNKTFTDVEAALSIVSTNYDEKRPFIFKNQKAHAHGMTGSFVPGFGVSIADAVQASCSAYPFFDFKKIKPQNQQEVTLVDGGFCANNPSILAFGDAVSALNIEEKNIRILSIGTGNYPERYPVYSYLQGMRIMPSIKLIATQFSSSSNTSEKVFNILSQRASVLRINDSFSDPALATSLFEYDKSRLSRLNNKGRDSFAQKESDIKAFFDLNN